MRPLFQEASGGPDQFQVEDFAVQGFAGFEEFGFQQPVLGNQAFEVRRQADVVRLLGEVEGVSGGRHGGPEFAESPVGSLKILMGHCDFLGRLPLSQRFVKFGLPEERVGGADAGVDPPAREDGKVGAAPNSQRLSAGKLCGAKKESKFTVTDG